MAAVRGKAASEIELELRRQSDAPLPDPDDARPSPTWSRERSDSVSLRRSNSVVFGEGDEPAALRPVDRFNASGKARVVADPRSVSSIAVFSREAAAQFYRAYQRGEFYRKHHRFGGTTSDHHTAFAERVTVNSDMDAAYRHHYEAARAPDEAKAGAAGGRESLLEETARGRPLRRAAGGDSRGRDASRGRGQASGESALDPSAKAEVQLTRLLEGKPKPHVIVIVEGGNDTHSADFTKPLTVGRYRYVHLHFREGRSAGTGTTATGVASGADGDDYSDVDDGAGAASAAGAGAPRGGKKDPKQNFTVLVREDMREAYHVQNVDIDRGGDIIPCVAINYSATGRDGTNRRFQTLAVHIPNGFTGTTDKERDTHEAFQKYATDMLREHRTTVTSYVGDTNYYFNPEASEEEGEGEAAAGEAAAESKAATKPGGRASSRGRAGASSGSGSRRRATAGERFPTSFPSTGGIVREEDGKGGFLSPASSGAGDRLTHFMRAVALDTDRLPEGHRVDVKQPSILNHVLTRDVARRPRIAVDHPSIMHQIVHEGVIDRRFGEVTREHLPFLQGMNLRSLLVAGGIVAVILLVVILCYIIFYSKTAPSSTVDPSASAGGGDEL
jgi:hypothetical protein